ncbi:MAG: Fe-S oxidoreductase [Microbacterium sp.]|uniref:Fe-S oxidoreductase n=1 Tax=Microbacterium sp. TaxID=51671 RepID=UPI001ACCF2AB|nr:Fe-S oxidoreductase [Microbacterium sp.]MBN9178440.1 Fe-S oxidoreductase [Microbacterium sp.]
MIPRPPAGWRVRAERAVTRGERLDAFIPTVLLDSPISRVGYWWGTTVGFVWGGLWSRGRIERRAGLWVFRGLPNWAFGRGGVCVGGCYLTGSAPVTDAVLAHEAVHARQWRRYGFLMPLLYLVAGRDPLRNRFEILAGLEDGNYVPRGS